MKFIELPVSRTLLNLNQINLIQHQVISETFTAIAHFTNGDKLITCHRDAEFLVAVIRDCV
jgi:hypothetical protein